MKVLEKRYLKKDLNGKVIETPEQMFRRVAHCIASAELAYDPQADVRSWEEKFYAMIASLEYLPNSPTLMNAGRELGQLSACFVLPIEDSMESIFEAVKQTALIHKSGGGTGFSFSRLRPESDRVGSTGGIASGPVSFLRVFDTATDVIKQGGMRRGANMAILSIDHPDILRFIGAKEKGTVFTNFNLSVAMTEEFMKAVDEGRDYDLINPHTRQSVQKLNAREVFDKIVDMAWRTGDPGIVFIDRMNKDNPTPKLGMIESTNPCGEQPLLPYESCNLGSINLSKMLRRQDGKVEIDYAKLADRVKLAVRFLDNIIEVNKFPTAQIEKMTKTTRKIGLGVMGFADALICLGIPYDSDEGLEIAENVMSFINKEATAASAELAKDRGAFPAFEGSIYDRPGQPKLRNAARTTIAPTGTLSIIAGCSSGIEPLFALSYMRTILEGEHLLEVNPYFEEVAKREGFYTEDLMKELATRGSARGMDKVPAWVQQVFVTAHDITPEWHVRMQAAFQKHTDNAVSKTVNFPHDATREDVAKVYRLAYELGCKGITIYRDGSKESQVLTINHEAAVEEKKAEIKVETPTRTPRKRPRVTAGSTERVSNWLRQPIRDGEPGRARHLRGLLHPGKDGGLRLGTVGGPLPPDLAVAAFRNRDRQHRGAAPGHTLPVHCLGGRACCPVLRRCHSQRAGEGNPGGSPKARCRAGDHQGQERGRTVSGLREPADIPGGLLPLPRLRLYEVQLSRSGRAELAASCRLIGLPSV